MKDTAMDLLFVLAVAASLCVISVAFAQEAPTAVDRPHHTVISQQASERGTAGVDNKIVTLDGKTHVVWQISTEEGYRNVVRTLDRATGKWSDMVMLGPGVDNHARPAITADSKGYLHVVIGGHNTPLRYMRSAEPNDSSKWVDNHTFGKGTYTSIICSKDDTLVISCRPSGVSRGNSGVDLYIRKPGEKEWTLRPRILRTEPQYTGYVGYNASITFGPDGHTLHFAADVYEGSGVYENRGTNQAVVYAVSKDMGDTWTKADGSPVGDPAYPKNLDVIYLSSREREQKMPTPICRLAGVVVDSKGTPFVLYTEHEPNAGEMHLVTPDGRGGWTRLGLAEAIFKAYPGYGALGARGCLGITEDDRIQAVVPIAPIEGLKTPGDANVDNDATRFIYITTAEGGTTYTITEPVPALPGNQHTPSLEKPQGHHGIAKDRNCAFLYIEGLHRYPKKDEVITNQCFYVEVPRQ